MGERAKKLKTVRLQTPVSDDDLAKLEIGSVVFLDGLIYTGRERVYEKILNQGETPQVDFTKLTNVNFHCAPAAAQNEDGSFNVGAVTATASFRFAKYLERWFAQFRREQFLILSSEQFFRDPSGSYREVLDFLQISPHELAHYDAVNVGSYASIDAGTRARLVDHFREPNRRLYELLDRDFDWT